MRLKLQLSMLAIALSQTFISNAENINSPMEILVTTGDRFENSPDQQLTVINTIERKEIVRLNPKSVIDVLETLPGVSITRNGGAGQSASISMRGTNFGHVLVLVDGVRIGSATLGSVSFNSLSPETIERIEVVKGPRAAIWGSDAIGGVVQIFTRQLEGGQWFATAEYGSNQYIKTSGGVGINHGDGRSTISLNREQSEGYNIKNDKENDDDGYKRLGVSIKGMQNLNQQWQLSWLGRLDSGDYQYDSISTNEANYNNYLWGSALQFQNQKLQSHIAVSQSRDKNENYRADNASANHLLYQTTRDQINWINNYSATENLTFIGGIDWLQESISGHYAVEQRELIGLYILARHKLDKLLLEGVARYDDVEKIDSETSYNASIGYQINDLWRIALNAGSAFKAPTFNDLYWPDTGNPALVSETSNNVDLTVNYSDDYINGYISFYQNKIDNLIQWAPNGQVDSSGYDIWQPANIAKAEITGVELSLNFNTWDLEHRLGYSYIDAIDSLTHSQLVGRSENEFDYSVGYNWSAFELFINYHYQGKRNAGDNNYDKVIDYLDAYNQIDLSLGYKLTKAWQLRLKANNFLDEDIISARNYFSPGRQVFFSISYKDY